MAHFVAVAQRSDQSKGCDGHQMKSTMPLSNPSVTQIAQVISQVTAPAFLLGEVAHFTSVLISRA
jgi:hypothetical protein